MSESQPPKKKVKKLRGDVLKKAFEAQPDEIVIFDPKEEGEFIMGKIADYGISKEFSTPFLVLLDNASEEITVFIKMGIIPKMRRKKWIDKDDKWITETVDKNIGNMIAFQYVEQATSERTKREFQKYKILFPEDLKKEGITDF